MKILQMSRWFFPHVGGASIRVYQIAKNLTIRGHEVHLLTHNPRSIEQCNLDEDFSLCEKHPRGFYVYRLPYYPGGKKLNWALSIPLMTKKAVEIIEREKIDVILSENPPYLVGTASALASKLTGVPVVIDAHDVWGASHYGFFERKVGKSLEHFCVKRSTKLVVALEGLDRVLVDRYQIAREKFLVAPNGVDPEEFKPVRVTQIELMQLRKALESVPHEVLRKLEDPSYKKVLFVGILAPWSGCGYLIEAAKRIKEKTLFVIVGHGVQREELEEKAVKLGVSDRVLFLGTIKPDVLPILMNMADVCASPFPKPEDVGRDATMPIRPISTLEFMSCGRPVVMSNIPGATELIKDGENGLLFKAGDSHELAEKIAYLLRNYNTATALGKAARESVLKGNTWADTARVVEKALKEAMGR